jgi:hypothetical protein
MKNHIQIIAFTFLLFFSMHLFARQTSRFPIQPGSVWRINYEYSCMDIVFNHENGDEEYKYFINGDTLIGSRSYYKLFKSGILYLDSPFEFRNKYMGAIRDSADHVFYVENKSGSEKLLYNFAAKVGESICSECGAMEYLVGEIDTLENGRKRFYIDVMTVHCGSANCLIEGIGWLGGLLEGNACYSHPGIRGSYLVCYSEGGIPAYQTEISRCGEKKVECNTDITSSKQTMLSKTPEITNLHNGLMEICLSGEPADLYSIEIFTVQGKKVHQQTAELPGIIDSKNIGSGIFLIRISNDKRIYTSKFEIRK